MSIGTLILASASSGRLRLLRHAGFDPQVVVSGVDESAVTTTEPAALVMELALAKASAVAAAISDGLIIGADSVLDLDGIAYGKPVDADDARRRWSIQAAAATVHFGRPDEAELKAYLHSGEPVQVAGAFTIDALGAQFVDSIDGNVGTVIGLSLPLLRAQAARLGIRLTDLWSTVWPTS